MSKSVRNVAASQNEQAVGIPRKTSFLELPIGKVMQRDVVTVATTTPLAEVQRTLAEARIGGAPVLDAEGKVAGVVSLHDIADRYSNDPESQPRRRSFHELESQDLDDGEDGEDGELEVIASDEATAADAMTAQVFSVSPATTVRDVAREMLRHEVHRLLVLDGEKMVGIVSTMDLVRAMAK